MDGYQGYEQTGARLAGCWAHARRKFIEAKTVQGKGKSGKADQALSFIQKLYGVEQKIKDDSPVQKQEKRTALAQPVMDKLKTWLDKSALQVNPQSLLGKAIHYTLKQWDKLQVYLHDGHVNIDNNRAERAIKPFVIGRKAWLFSNSRGGAQASVQCDSLASGSSGQPARKRFVGSISRFSSRSRSRWSPYASATSASADPGRRNGLMSTE